MKTRNPFVNKKVKFVKQFFEAASEAAKAFDLNVSVMLAQAAIESGWGESGISTTNHNYFGIIACGKPNNYWHGSKSALTKRGLSFRRYNSPTDSFMDYGRLLRAQYPRAAALSYQPAGFAQEIAYSAYICEINGDDRVRYKKLLIAIEQDIRAIMDDEKLIVVDPRKDPECAECAECVA